MTTPPNRLVPLPRSDWPALRNLYRRDWPKHLLGYQLVDGFIRWIALEPGIVDLEIFSLNGDWMGDGTFVAAVSVKYKYKICKNYFLCFIAESRSIFHQHC